MRNSTIFQVLCLCTCKKGAFRTQHNRSRFKKFKYEIKKFLQNHKRTFGEVSIFTYITKKGDGHMYFKYRSKAGREFEFRFNGGVWFLVVKAFMFLNGGG
jgi:chlorite dismutase